MPPLFLVIGTFGLAVLGFVILIKRLDHRWRYALAAGSGALWFWGIGHALVKVIGFCELWRMPGKGVFINPVTASNLIGDGLITAAATNIAGIGLLVVSAVVFAIPGKSQGPSSLDV